MNREQHIELDLKKIEALGEIREDENYEFRTFLKQKNPERIDEIVHRLNEEVSSRIDCTKCGNCCATLQICVTHHDLERIAGRAGAKVEQIKEDYTETDEFNDLVFKHVPCSFLKEKKCSIYEARPDNCRSFPHLHKPGFTSRLWGVVGNYSVCPIVFNVFERLKKELHWKY
ncbi:hypothetical protein C900_00689 [Fulvivirga imtechensis AK7]|uniref:Fe-S-cluster oxidoreductase n=1 Tax=Fulvivirga imtechensis AK7 TaxID=1237149 RepID=L8JH22_9BACT|nr:YkgJ family cysteine cluster protein [Fulvivirga imtechensis]ELR68161.1 hypothetical protein C900_00689 [Fulvivirga imtechensis AK7]